jgi:hypothetical protein
VKQIKVDGNQKSEKRKARNRLHDIGEPHDRLAQLWITREQNACWNANQYGNSGRDPDKNEMLQGQSEEFTFVS